MSELSTRHSLKRSATFPSSNETIMTRPIITQTSTFDSSSADEGDRELTIRRSHSTDSEEDTEDGICNDSLEDLEKGPISSNEPERSPVNDKLDAVDGSIFSTWSDVASHLYFVSTLAIFGMVTRFYLGRFFGLDCLLKEHNILGRKDFFSNASSMLCITSDGKLQRGGALFIDLPANILGSFIMGLISPNKGNPALPWFRPDHPLQKHTAFRIGMQVGFCGCLTTFSSWNNQMVIMMDGTDTEFGPQVGTAIFGYVLGVACAISSFICGRYVYEWLRYQPELPTLAARGITVVDSMEYSEDRKAVSHARRETGLYSCKSIDLKCWLFVAVTALFLAFVLEDVIGKNLAYREMWMAVILTPCGALLRWRLSELNDNDIGRIRSEWAWFPRGTFAVNVVASLICASIEAFLSRQSSAPSNWMSPSLRAVEMGFAGSLSTVSTLVREMLSMDTPGQASRYCLATIVCSMLLSLLIYSPMIRAG